GSAPATSLVQQVGGAQFEIDQGAFIVRLIDPRLEPDRCGTLPIEVGEVVAGGHRYVGPATGGSQKHNNGCEDLNGACFHASWLSSAARCSNLGCTLFFVRAPRSLIISTWRTRLPGPSLSFPRAFS